MILIIGGSGYLASKYASYFSSQGIEFSLLKREFLDYYDVSALIRYLKEIKPKFLINAAGFTGKPNVDQCELHKKDTLLANAILPTIIQEACEATQTPWGHVSSGCIFQGRRADGEGFSEEDVPNFSFRTNNCSFYSGSKALAEEMLQGASKCYIWRLRVPFNNEPSPRNYLTKIITYERLLNVENSLSQIEEFVQATYLCWKNQLPYGTYNVTNPGSIWTKEIVELIYQEKDFRKKNNLQDPFPDGYDFFESEEEFMQKAAKAPRSSCVLDSSKLINAGVYLAPVRTAIENALRHWNEQLITLKT